MFASTVQCTQCNYSNTGFEIFSSCVLSLQKKRIPNRIEIFFFPKNSNGKCLLIKTELYHTPEKLSIK